MVEGAGRAEEEAAPGVVGRRRPEGFARSVGPDATVTRGTEKGTSRVFLKALTLRGFKSFADKTTLEFEPGVMVVVGPNGSGKSNLVDAVAWVLGAQGPRSLRGGKMDDVIFAGSETRRVMGLGEVQLTINNDSGALPVAFAWAAWAMAAKASL